MDTSNLPQSVLQNRIDNNGDALTWDTQSFHDALIAAGARQSLRTSERELENLLPAVVSVDELIDENGRQALKLVVKQLVEDVKRKRHQSLILQLAALPESGYLLLVNDGRSGRRWIFVDDLENTTLIQALDLLAAGKTTLFWPHGEVTRYCRDLQRSQGSIQLDLPSGTAASLATVIYREPIRLQTPTRQSDELIDKVQLSHLDRLEAESIHIIREVVAQAENPVMLYSIGKDSAVMLHLAKKAFYPSPPPFPLMHVDTRWKFTAMYDFRDRMAEEVGMDLIVHTNPEGVEKNINPYDHGSALHTDVMKTQGLKQALDKYKFDVAFGGARRDEEKSRAKERVFSFRTTTHRWDPKNQRPELWNLYNGYKKKDESIRVFPLSNWTELDIWQYIYREEIPLVPLYFAAERPVVKQDGMLVLVDDDRMRLFEDDKVEIRKVRFRTLGCYPLTGAIESDADDLSSIVLELLQSRTSERDGRAIDSDSSASMEKKKQEGYF
jgi:sulfate adenylyltransferase subunit 2